MRHQKIKSFDAQMDTRTGVLFGKGERPQLFFIRQALIQTQRHGGVPRPRGPAFFFLLFDEKFEKLTCRAVATGG